MIKPSLAARFACIVLALAAAALPAAAQTEAPPALPLPSAAAPAAKPGPAATGEAAAIDELKKSAPRVFVDGERLDMNYIKEEIQFVNYVRDRQEADVDRKSVV